MGYVITAYLHFVAIFGLLTVSSINFFLLSPTQTRARSKHLILLDVLSGVLAVAVLATGALRMWRYGKGWDYYLHNIWFHGKIYGFMLWILISLYPMWKHIQWHRQLQQQEVLAPQPVLGLRVSKAGEVLLILLLTGFATLLARGYGVIR